MRVVIYPEGLTHCRISRDGALCDYLCFGRLAFRDMCRIHLMSIEGCVVDEALEPRAKLDRNPGEDAMSSIECL